MSARNVPFGSMFAWIPATFRLVRNHAGAMAMASIITLLAALLMMAPMFFFMFKSLSGLGAPGVPLPQDLTGLWVAYAVMVVVGLLLMPPLLAGWFRMCADADRGAAISGTEVLAPYGDGATWMRLVGFALLAVLAYGLIFGLLFLAFHGLFDELLATQAAQAAAMAAGAQPPPPSPAMIVKFLALEAVLIPVMIVLQFIYMVGFAEVSMRATPPIAALSLAAGGVFRNILKLVLFLFCFGMVLSVGMMIVFLVFGLVAMLLAFVSPVLAIVVIAIAYVVFLAFVYPMMFAMHYYMWKAMLGDEAPASPQPGAVAA